MSRQKIEIFSRLWLQNFSSFLKIPVTCESVEVGPSLIYYHINLNNILQLNKIKKLAEYLSAELHVPVRAIKSERAHFALTIPRKERKFPRFFEYSKFLEGQKAGTMLFGIDDHGQPLIKNIQKTKSLLIGGASGGGKSVCLSQLILSVCLFSNAAACGLILIDLKRCEFGMFEKSHHLIRPVIFDYKTALAALIDIKAESQRRYKLMQTQKVRKANLKDYPLIIVIIDEFAELMQNATDKKQLEALISSIAATGRACNIFLIIATQHAVSGVISNTIKSNLQSKIGLRTTNVAQSSCLIGSKECVDLLGYGDALGVFDGTQGLTHFQCCNITDEELEAVFSRIKLNSSKENHRADTQKEQRGFFAKFKAWVKKTKGS
jgi:DNA segregation ATPase FtsK/SpoIIIE, S-DNA-T family